LTHGSRPIIAPSADVGVFLKDFRRGRCLDPLFGYVAKEPDRWFPKWMLNT